jgi:hypothetical protein
MPMMRKETPQTTMFAMFPILPLPASGGPHSTLIPTGAVLGSAGHTASLG